MVSTALVSSVTNSRSLAEETLIEIDRLLEILPTANTARVS